MSSIRKELRALRKTSSVNIPFAFDVRDLKSRDEMTDRAVTAGTVSALSALGITGLSTLHPSLRPLQGVGHGLLRYGVPVSIATSLGTSMAQDRGWLP